MSLRARIVVAIALVLALGALLGLALAGLQARQWLRAELTSAQTSGAVTVARDAARAPRTAYTEQDLAELVATFDGNRHLRALLVGADGRVLATSHPAPTEAPPAWFAALLRQEIAPRRLATPVGSTIVLQPVYADDMAAVWAEFLDLGLVLALSGLGGAAVIFVVVGRALRPLQEVGEVLPRIGAGDYGARARITGPPELGRLARGVNEMAGRLAAMHDHNRALEDQILRLQDEERAEIARNLHDEIGPQLFAANIDAGMAGSLIAEGRLAEAQTHARAIQSAIGQIQRLVRDILERLRPTPLVELGLMAAIGDLVDFWRARRPEVAFRTELSSSESGLSEATQEAVYRVVQESLSNAIRHGAPRNIVVAVKREAGRLTVNVANDGSAVVAGRTGLGLTGMAERVRNCGGSLQAGPAPDGGWRVVATLVIATEQEHAA